MHSLQAGGTYSGGSSTGSAGGGTKTKKYPSGGTSTNKSGSKKMMTKIGRFKTIHRLNL